ncbi:hypothetical protein V1278_000487 [Bradyrhizobium sp. AZCC 1577]
MPVSRRRLPRRGYQRKSGMIRKSGYRFSLGTNAKRLPGDHAQIKEIEQDDKVIVLYPFVCLTALTASRQPMTPKSLKSRP